MTPGVKRRVARKKRRGICVRAGCSCKMHTRGLCGKHYEQFKYARRISPKPEMLDKEEVELGNILPSQQGRKSSNPYIRRNMEAE